MAALSGYAFEFDIPEDRRSIPTFLYNGEMDDLVKFDMANRSFDLTLQGVNVTKHSEPRMGHEVSEREI